MGERKDVYRGKHCTNIVRSIKAVLMLCGALDFVLFLREKVTLVKVRVLIRLMIDGLFASYKFNKLFYH